MVPFVLLLFLRLVSTAEDVSVSQSLSDVWTSFGDLAGTLYTVRIAPSQEGRGQKEYSMLLPLAIGFKAGGAIMSALTALKLLVIKTVALSGFALLASLALTGKYLYDKIQQPLYEITPYHFAPVHEVTQTWEPSYEVQQTHADAYAVQDNPADQLGHYSSPISLTTNGTQTSQRKYFQAAPVYRRTVYKTKYRG